MDKGVSRRPASPSASIGIDGKQIILAARLDAVTGIIEDGHIGAFGIFGEAFEIAVKLGRVAVGDATRLEAERRQQLGDLTRVGAGIGERRQMAVARLSDHQRYALERPGFLGEG